MKKTIIQHGLIAGLIVSASMCISAIYYSGSMNFDTGMFWGFLSMFLAFSFVFIGTHRYRKQNEGKLTFLNALFIGLGISFIAAVFYVGTWDIIFRFYYPDFMSQYAAHTINKLKETGADATAVATAQASLDAVVINYQKTWYRMITSFTEIFPLGIVISLISALVFRKK